MTTQEERERALHLAVDVLRASSPAPFSEGYDATKKNIARAIEALRDCVPIPKDELARYKRALREIASGGLEYGGATDAARRALDEGKD